MARDCKVQFEAYVEASDNTLTLNDMTSRTIEYIAFGPSEYRQGLTLCFNFCYQYCFDGLDCKRDSNARSNPGPGKHAGKLDER